jgi:glycosyltransferase involved in cell wall biosynthesis
LGDEMKVTFLMFPIEKVGGIITWEKNLDKGFKALGYETEHLYLSTNKKILPEKVDECGFIFEKPNIYGFEKGDWLLNLKSRLSDTDYIIFSHTCPHLTKAYNSTAWVKVFEIVEELQKPYLTVSHDMYVDKFYPWFVDLILKRFKVKVVAVQTKTELTFKDKPCMLKTIPFPFERTGEIIKDKEKIILDPSNFKSCKHKEITLSLSDIAKVVFFGDGIERHKLEKLPEWKKIEWYGWGTEEQLISFYKRAKILADFSYFGEGIPNTDYVMLEGANWGCILVTQTLPCPKYNLKVIKIDKFSLKKTILSILNDEMDVCDLVEHNFEALNSLKPKPIAQQYIDFLKADFESHKVKTGGLLAWSK